LKDFVKKKLQTLGISEEKYITLFAGITNSKNFDDTIEKLKNDGETAEFLEKVIGLKKYFNNSWNWQNPIQEYIARTYIDKYIPKFMYYDDYYMLPSRISIDKINKGDLSESSEKTARALLELADIDTKNIIGADSYEDFKAELEATQAIISEELFKYWSTNKNLRILFDIDKKIETDSRNNQRIVDHILDIRVENLRSMVSLPLANRSKGFNWFFSFLVWFKKIQENKDTSYILLLDEPGLNLHAMAQHDLLSFIEDLSSEYQIIYTTHSPFMIESSKLQRVRTVVEEIGGTHVTDCLQEKDPNTLFPLQAALGYTLAQNLFVSEKNLLVEGIADLVYINILSNTLNSMKRTSLKEDITIVPVGGADKVATFVSLMRGNDLKMTCLLDTFTEQSAKARLDNLIAQNIIKGKKVMFYHDILKTDYADVEDLFKDNDYLVLYNDAFGKSIEIKDIDSSEPIMEQLKKINGGKNFNHYTPANFLAKNAQSFSFSDETLDNFEKLFVCINKTF
jgi:predicted ATPase